MGHRASIGYVRQDGTVQAHYSHRGALDARLAFDTALDESRPYGSGEESTADQRNTLRASLVSDAEAERIWDYDDSGGEKIGEIGQEPYGTFEDLEAWATDGVDFLYHECAYVVDTRPDDWTVGAYDTLWWKGPAEETSEWEHAGILVELHDGDEWGDFAHGPEDDPRPDNTMELGDWEDAALEWLGSDAQRVPSFSPLPRDNRA